MHCLHCEISELMMRRQAAGEVVDVDTIGRLCEVIADVAASHDADAPQIFAAARTFLARFERDVADGTFTKDRAVVTAAQFPGRQ